MTAVFGACSSHIPVKPVLYLYKATPVLWNCVLYLTNIQTMAWYLPSFLSLDRFLWHTTHTYARTHTRADLPCHCLCCLCQQPTILWMTSKPFSVWRVTALKEGKEEEKEGGGEREKGRCLEGRWEKRKAQGQREELQRKSWIVDSEPEVRSKSPTPNLQHQQDGRPRHLHTDSLFVFLTHTHTHENTHHLRVTWMPHFTECTARQCWYTALTCRVCTESSFRGLNSAWPLQASIHICLLFCFVFFLFLGYFILFFYFFIFLFYHGRHWEQANAKKATIYLKVDTPLGWGSITAPVVSGTTSPLWTQGSCPQPTHRHTPFELEYV